MNQRGVTLIELVVGLAITASILAAAYGGITTALDRREEAVAAVRRELEAAAVRASLRSWLESAHVPGESSTPLFSGADGFHEGLPDDRLSFVTSAPTPLGAAMASVVLFIDRDPESTEQGLVAAVSEWLGTRRLRIELAPEAIALEVRYRSDVLSGRPWHPSWISTTVMPAGVKLRLIGAGDESLDRLLWYPIRVALPGGR